MARPLRKTAHFLIPLLLGGAILVGALFNGASAQKPGKAANPHFNADGCKICHTGDGAPVAIDAAQADAGCLSCHDGVKAAAEFHPVARAHDPKKYSIPEKWPLVQGRIACLTCHDMKIACDPKVTRRGANRMLLRDFAESRVNAKPFCQNCHLESAYKKINPHAMLLEIPAEGSATRPARMEIIDEKCLFCHTKIPDREVMKRSADPLLKAEQTTLCRDCHPQHKDPMNQSHLGLRLKPEILAMMSVRESVGLAARVNDGMLNEIKNKSVKPTLMVGDANGQITCSTCHNPHQSGVFPQRSVLEYRSMRRAAGDKLVSPVRGQIWCRHCHEF